MSHIQSRKGQILDEVLIILIEWLGIVICNFLVKNNLQIKILLLHQKDKLENKIKQDHFARLQQGQLKWAKGGTTLGEYFYFLDNRTYPTIMHTTLALNYEKINHYLPSNYYSRAFWNVQKHDFLILGLSETFRNE